MADADGITSTTTRYVIPCTDKQLIDTARDALTGWPTTHGGTPLIGLEVAPMGGMGGLHPGGDWATAGFYWDERQTTALFADGARFTVHLGTAFGERLTDVTFEVPVPSWAHVLRIPLVKAPAAKHPKLITVEGTSLGPYVGLPVEPTPGPYSDYLFTRATVQDIINDLHTGHTEVTAQWEGELLRFEWSEDHDGVAGQHLLLPDEHDRYPLGGLWTWVPWNDPIAQSPVQQAYAVGASEYTSPVTTEFDGDLFLDYLRGRVEASRLTLHRNEP